MKVMQCSGFPGIYAQLQGDLCTGVVAFHRSIVDWRRGMGWGEDQSAMGICAFC